MGVWPRSKTHVVQFVADHFSGTRPMARLYNSTTFVRLKRIFPSARRRLATSSSNTPFQVFNTEAKRHQRNRAAIIDPGTSRRTDYLRDEVAMRLAERFMVLYMICLN
jgi:hypothetical protein